MIVRIFSTGKSRGEGPVNYLLNKSDHTGTPRCFEPEILDGGNPKTTIDIINSIDRDWKYVSGAIAFRNEEQPTHEQMLQLIDKFKQTFCAGLNNSQFNSLFVLHKDKGNHEIHFVVPMIELTTGKRLNIHPPGAKNIDLYQAFTKTMNHELGYAQVLSDPLKIALPSHKLKSPEFKDDQRKNILLEKEVKKAIVSGKVENRTQLCKFLDEELGVSIHRQGKDYISIRLPGDIKSRRLRGPMFEENANYRDMLAASRKAKVPVKLTDTEYQEQKTILSSLVNERRAFNETAYSRTRPVRLGGVNQTSPITNPSDQIKTIRSPHMKTDYLPIIKKMIMEALSIAREKKLKAQNPVQPIPSISQSKSNMARIRDKALNNHSTAPQGNNLSALIMAISEVEQSISESIGEMNANNDPMEKAKLQQRVIKLRLYLEKLNNELRMEKIRIGASIATKLMRVAP